MFKYIKRIFIIAMFCIPALFMIQLLTGIMGSCRIPFSIMAQAAEMEKENKYAYLYFYTIDGEEIEKLEKKVKAEKEYTFKDPNEYRYLPQEGADGELIYSEFYDQVKGIYWEEESDKGDLGQYKTGDVKKFKAGEHYFRVKSDNPALTGENLIDTPSSEHAYLYFYSADGDIISELEKELTEEDEYTFENPDEYVRFGENAGESNLNGNGIYWTCTDANGKHYLFKEGNKCKFKPGDYEFYPVTDDPVTVTFYYPIDVDTYLADEHTPGEQYTQIEAVPGTRINLKKSLGAIIWESSFIGWRETNFESVDKIFNGGTSYQIVSNTDLDFFAEYEYDENWDIDAKDENLGAGDLDNSEAVEDIIVDVDKINLSAGAGYGAYVDTNGKLRRIGNRSQINPGTKLSGIKGSIKKETWLSSLTSPDADPNDPENYEKDKYGRPFTESNLEKEMNNVLKQDDSAMYMDVYGNAFIYYRNLTREANMSLALERLQNGKTDSWVNNVQDWDQEVINRFEAIEFAFLKGKYPQEGENLFAGLDPEVTHGEELIWKSEYMSEKSYKKLKPYRQIWAGWYSSYDDGLYEKYRQRSGTSGGVTVGKRLIPDSLWGITAYAAEKNDVGGSNQYGARKNNSIDLKDTQFKPQYYDPSKLYSFSSYSFSGLAGLDAERIGVLTKIFNALTEAGFSKEAAAGACGNIWQECTFNPKAGYPNNGYIGIVQWGGGRDVKLKNFAASKNKEWTDIDVQIEFMIHEINTGYLAAMNRQLNTYNGMKNIKAVDNVQIACDIWAAAMEGCVCSVTSHSVVDCPRVNGKKYQELRQRREYSQKVFNAMTMTSGILGGSFVGKSNQEIIGQIFPGLTSVSKIDLNPNYTPRKMEANYIVSTPAPGYGRLRVNKYIADDVTAIFTELERIKFPIEVASGYNYRGISIKGSGKYYPIGSGKMSFHASGLAIDINWSQNPYFNVGTSNSNMMARYQPGKEPKAITMEVYNIFKSHGLLWGRDFSNCYDIMHFSLAEVTQDGRNAHVYNICVGQ